MAVTDPDAMVQDGLVEQLLEAEEKLEASHETHHLSGSAGSSVLQIQVCGWTLLSCQLAAACLYSNHDRALRAVLRMFSFS